MTHILQQEVNDLRMFGDPFEEFLPALRSDSWTIKMIRGGREFRLVRNRDGRITVNGRKPYYRDFRALLVSEQFANLPLLATALRHSTRALDHEISDLGARAFLPNRGTIRWPGREDAELSFQSVDRLLEEQSERLRIYVINGVAGVGKTKLVERIVRKRSEPASYKAGKALLFHVQSLGKVLTSLDDRIAGTLSSLRASFVREELTPLIRRDLVQLAIDGFDELSDSRGYDRAWGALRDFIRELKGRGVCILAGRDTMLDMDAVLRGLGNVVPESSVIFLNIEHPSPLDIRKWLERKPDWAGSVSELKEIEKQATRLEYLRRPFFVQSVARLGPDRFADMGGDPLVALMESMVAREGEKMIPDASSGIDRQKSGELYAEVLSEAARMMMDDETPGIEIELLRMLIEEVFLDAVNKETLDAIAQRAETLALLESDPRDERIRVFPHENIRSYFFSRSIANYLPEYGAMNALHRTHLSAEDLFTFNRVVRRQRNRHSVREALHKVLRDATPYGVLSSNIGGLLLSILPFDDEVCVSGEYTLANLTLRDAWMAEHNGVQRANLVNCRIDRLDARGADLGKVSFSNVDVYEMLADSYVVFGGSPPNIDVLVTEGQRRNFDRSAIRQWVAERSSPGESPEAPDKRWPLLEKLARMSMRSYWIFDRDEAMEKLMRSPHWESLAELLQEHRRLEVTGNVDASGSSRLQFHLIAGQDFLQDAYTEESTSRIKSALGMS